jgi:hypothetical protein
MTTTKVASKPESTTGEILNACINWVADEFKEVETEEGLVTGSFTDIRLWKSNQKGWSRTRSGQRYFAEGVEVYVNDTVLVISKVSETGVAGTIALTGFASRNPELIIGAIISAMVN